MFPARYGLNLGVMYINPSKSSGHYMYICYDFDRAATETGTVMIKTQKVGD
jgi:hypothetical protein